MSTVEQILKAQYPDELVDELLRAYETIVHAFQARRWKASQLDAGHFVEAVRRVVELEVTGTYTPLDKRLAPFGLPTLQKYENGSCHESLRILIPRILWGIYAIRNKRGVAHLGEVSPNEMDATTVMRMARWVLAELVRLKSKATPADTEALIHALVQRDLPTVWTVQGVDRVMQTNLRTREKVLVLLYARDGRSPKELQEAVEYKNTTRFGRILQALHRDRLIEHNQSACFLSPLGEQEAESILDKVA